MFNHVEHDIVLPKLTRKTTEEGRRYFTPDGNAYPSITTVLGVLSKEGIIAWRQRVGEEEANKISRQAATRGTAVHKLAEDIWIIYQIGARVQCQQTLHPSMT